MNHLDALNLGLSNERARLAAAKNTNEIALRKVWVAQIEREIEAENKFIGEAVACNLTDDELLAALMV